MFANLIRKSSISSSNLAYYSVALMLGLSGCLNTEALHRTNTTIELLALHNQVRRIGGICGKQIQRPAANLEWSELLSLAAQRHAVHLAKKEILSHTGKYRNSLKSRINKTGYKWQKIGENLAFNHFNANVVFKDWLGRLHHCQNIFDSGFNQMGAARTGDYWVVVFGKSSDVNN